MFTTIMIAPTNLGMTYNEAESVKAFAVIERVVGAVVLLGKFARSGLRNGHLWTADAKPTSPAVQY